MADESALTHQVSIIQGPPGTGKTQTILNIIANLLMADKTVLVVSNNNSVVENVAEKLESEGLSFIVAKLGSAENKETFIANQHEYPGMDGWMIEESHARQKAMDLLRTVSQGFDTQMLHARKETEYDALLKEMKYNDMLQKDEARYKWLSSKSSFSLMKDSNRTGIESHNLNAGIN